MVQTPPELTNLVMRKNILLSRLNELMFDKTMLAEIKQLVGADLKGIFKEATGIGSGFDLSCACDVRKRLAIKEPGALITFDELISVSQEYDRKKKPGIVY